MNEGAAKKAELLASPPIYIPKDSRPRFLEVSSTGPGAGVRSAFLKFDGHRVIKEVSESQAEGSFVLRRSGEKYEVVYPDGSPFLSCVELERSLIHAPEQAFLNIEQRCVFNCAFCASSGIRNRTHILSDERVLTMLDDAVRKGAKGVALTSGVWPDTSAAVDRVARLLSKFREMHPEMVLGAEIYTETPEDLVKLREAGVSELKLNVEVATGELCRGICPQKDFEAVHRVLEEAVTVFGSGNVTSNIIYGLGETDDEVIAETERLAEMGVVPNLRALRTGRANASKLSGFSASPPDKERIIRLSEGLKEILLRTGLTTTRFRTMCHACGACDLQPSIDF